MQTAPDDRLAAAELAFDQALTDAAGGKPSSSGDGAHITMSSGCGTAECGR
jgi:hypothetical protein